MLRMSVTESQSQQSLQPDHVVLDVGHETTSEIDELLPQHNNSEDGDDNKDKISCTHENQLEQAERQQIQGEFDKTRTSKRQQHFILVDSSTFLSFIIFGLGWYGPKWTWQADDFILRMKDDQVRSSLYQTTKSGDAILDFGLMHPLIDPPKVPSFILITTAIWVPWALLIVMRLSAYCRVQSSHKRDNNFPGSRFFSFCFPPGALYNYCQIHSITCGLAMSIGVSEAVTQVLKCVIRRKRPNFYALCGWDLSQLQCTASKDRIMEAQLSFPSGHSSLTACGMTFFVWMILGWCIQQQHLQQQNLKLGQEKQEKQHHRDDLKQNPRTIKSVLTRSDTSCSGTSSGSNLPITSPMATTLQTPSSTQVHDPNYYDKTHKPSSQQYLWWSKIVSTTFSLPHNGNNHSDPIETYSKLSSTSYFTTIFASLSAWLWTIFVATTRIVDHWHHYSDILAGLALGFTCATFVYHLWYPPIWSSVGVGIPRTMA